MSITTSCPQCKSLFRLPDEVAGKTLRCQKCQHTFLVHVQPTGPSEMAAAMTMVRATAPIAAPQSQAADYPPPPVFPPIVMTPAPAVEPKPPPLAPVAPPTVAEQAPAKPIGPPPLPELADLPRKPVGPLWAAITLAAFVSALVVTGVRAAFWVYARLAAPRAPAPKAARVVQPPPFAGKGKKGNFRGKRGLHTINAALDDKGRYEDRRVLTNADPREFNRNRGAYKVYFVPLKEGNYVFELQSKVFSPRLTLYDPAGKQLGDGIDNPNQDKSEIVHPCADGTYRLHVAAAFPGELGDYTLTISRQERE